MRLPTPMLSIISTSQLQELMIVVDPVLSRGGLLLSIRGGESVDSSKYIQSAVGYFNNLRVPAAVLMSIVMKEMFTLQATPSASMKKWDVEHGVAQSKRWRILRYSYLLLMVLAFCLETFTIFVATQVLTELATASPQRMVPLIPLESNLSLGDEVGKGFFGMKSKKDVQSMVDFLIANFEFEYATCRFHFVTGLLCFTVATALRVRYALRKYSDLSMSGMCCLLATATGMLTYTNAHTITYGGYVNLMRRQLQLSGRFLLDHVRSGPLSLISAFLACLTVVYAILGAFSPEFASFEIDDEDRKYVKQ